MSVEGIEIEISPIGEVSARTFGIKGVRCVDLATMLAEIVGAVNSHSLTAEFYEQADEVQNEFRLRSIKG
ncbi:MAG: DUF2997 domain-containing protein [Planctomycetaceae bacterium]